MNIAKYCAPDEQINAASQAAADSLLTQEQIALDAARLAIARWISSSAAHVRQTAPPAMPSRDMWYNQAQQNFEEWLARGGFGQYDCAEVGTEHNTDTLA